MKDPVIILFESTTKKELAQLESELPSDVHFVRYKKPSWKKKEKLSAIRAYRKSDIFDHLHDRGYAVLEIVSGFGRIRPNCFTK
jgi:hypothetical protein